MICTCQFPDELSSKEAACSSESDEILDEITISSRKTGAGRPPIRTHVSADLFVLRPGCVCRRIFIDSNFFVAMSCVTVIILRKYCTVHAKAPHHDIIETGDDKLDDKHIIFSNKCPSTGKDESWATYQLSSRQTSK